VIQAAHRLAIRSRLIGALVTVLAMAFGRMHNGSVWSAAHRFWFWAKFRDGH
jgi:hypothetical protein